jgi:hypothetical protein
MERFWSKVAIGPSNTCWPWIAKAQTPNGYGVFWFDMGDGARLHTAHRVALFLSGVKLTPGMDVMHSCDNRKCCNPDHLSEGTRTENMRDCAAKGRTRRTPTITCEAHHKAKLTDAQVAFIKTAVALGGPYGLLARRFGVSNEIVGCIARGRTWKPIAPASADEVAATLRGWGAPLRDHPWGEAA